MCSQNSLGILILSSYMTQAIICCGRMSKIQPYFCIEKALVRQEEPSKWYKHLITGQESQCLSLVQWGLLLLLWLDAVIKKVIIVQVMEQAGVFPEVNRLNMMN